ncbi:RNA-protein complex protein Nop10 [Candidatus Methanoprimaticola sp. MG2]|uniref:RNA-protein complex protein Nop10 n=1 Tax=Candidatus Methanoprimaticola sp. MG2 TaxID=3228838 RepID=UPI0039C6118A
MSSRIRRCNGCGHYTLDDTCPECGVKTSCPVPPKYSPEDRMGQYRRADTIKQWSETKR